MKAKMSGSARAVLLLAVLGLPILAASTGFAQPEREKVLRRLDFKEVEGGVEVSVQFNRPLRYVRHSPKNRGKIVRLELAEASASSEVDDGIRRREALDSTYGTRSPLVEVVHERSTANQSESNAPSIPARSLLILRFRKTTDFEIRPGSKGRSITVLMKTKAESKFEPETAAEEPEAAPTRLAEILVEGRKAMTAGEYTRAAALFELVLSTDATSSHDTESKRDAKEMLGLARERNRQLAHARAEYEEYLELYPDGEGTTRVRQRLQALVTAEAQASPRLREVPPDDSRPKFDLFGDLALAYSRDEDLTGDFDDPVFDSRLIADMDVTGRTEVRGYELTGDLSLSHDHDFNFDPDRSGKGDLTRVILLSLEAESPDGTYGGVIGRQTRRSAGVLGRFDGVVAMGDLDDHFSLSGVFGFPLERSISSKVNTDRMFFGSAIDVEGYLKGSTAQLFTIGQFNQGLVDRAAIGAELNYVGGWGYTRAFLDYDAFFNTLNLALLSASVNIGSETQLHSYLQAQTSPFLTLSSALQGQDAADLDDLREEYSKREIRSLAKDRTARSYTATLGASHWINPELQMAADVTVVATGSTDASDESALTPEGGIPANPSFGPNVSTSVQLTKNNLYMNGDISSASLRFSEGDVLNRYQLFLRTRVPLWRDLYVDPRLSVGFRDRKRSGDDQVSIRAAAQLRWNWKDIRVEFEPGIDSVQYLGGRNDDQLNYLIETSVRYEF